MNPNGVAQPRPSLVRRGARGLLAAAARRGHGQQPWGDAILAEFDYIEGTWPSVRWAISGLRMAWTVRAREVIAARVPRSRAVRALLATVLLTGSAFGFTAVTAHVVVQPLVIPSASMLPTFHPTDRVLVDRLPWHNGTVADGEVVAFTIPTGDAGLAPARADWMGWLGRMIDQPDGMVLVKRVVAVGGQRLACRDGRVYRDGIPLPEPYLAPWTVTTCDPVAVPAGKVFVLGDNREDSADSRVFGPIDQRRITGRVIHRIWPLERHGPVR